MPKTVLVIAAHPDDEALMCGGAIAKHAAQGDPVFVLFVADGETARYADPADPGAMDAIEARKAAARKAAETLGAEDPLFLGFPDNRLDSLPLLDIVKPVERVIADIRPETVITHAVGDLNIDHQLVGKAVATACRPLPGRSVRAIYAAETLSASEWGLGASFAPRRYVDISAHVETKIAALKSYGAEIPAPPHARSEEAVLANARLRGAQAGLHFAEAFEVIREID